MNNLDGVDAQLMIYARNLAITLQETLKNVEAERDRLIVATNQLIDKLEASKHQLAFKEQQILDEREAHAKIAEAQKPISREEAPEHWKAYKDSWEAADRTATEIAKRIRDRK